jgi:hypothetical protein
MPDYRETTATGKAYRRCYKLEVNNPLGAVPSIRFLEEEVLEVGETCVTRPNTEMFVKMDSMTSIQALDPSTGLTTGQVLTHNDLYAILYSAYMHAARKRDSLEG